jgi:hypothetical protein
MKKINFVKPMLAFVAVLWAIVVVTYASQVKNDRLNGKDFKKPGVMDVNSSCSSSSSSGLVPI